MYKVLITLIVLIFSACTFDDTPHIKELMLKAEKQVSHEGTIHKNVVYKSTLFHNVELDIYEPLALKYKKAPIYIYIHGGSWLRGDKALVNVYDKTVQGLREQGIAVVSINYRFVSQSGISAMISDCLDAVRYVQEHASQYGLDAHTIGLHGHSAGANLALVTGLTLSKHNSDIIFIVDEYGPTDVLKLLKEQEDRVWWTYLVADSSLEALSPVLMLHPNVPPVYIAHGDADKMVPIEQSKSLYMLLQKSKIPSSFTVVHGAKHGYGGIDDAVIQRHRKEVLGFMLDKYREAVDIKTSR